MKNRSFFFALLVLLIASLVLSTTGPLVAGGKEASALIETLPADPQAWPMYNHDAKGTRWNAVEHQLGPHNVGRLRVQWTFSTQGAVAGTPVVADDIVYTVDSSATATVRRFGTPRST